MQPQSKAQFLIREATVEDHPFIYSSWLKSFRDGPAVKGITNSTYYSGQHQVIENLITEKSTVILLACNPEDSLHIYGYIVATENCVHWVYVKLPFRQFGICKTLIQALVKTDKKYYTHLPKILHRKASQFSSFEYNPYLLFKKG